MAYRMFALNSILEKFTNPTDQLARLIQALQKYIDNKVDRAEWAHFQPLELQVLRKTSGSIITILLGSKRPDHIQSVYCPEIDQMRMLPILYTSKEHKDTPPGEFVVARKALEARRDSRKYVQWKTGPPPPDIYLVEKQGDDPFILATLLGTDVTSDVIMPLSRDSSTVKDAIRKPSEAPWITDDGWVAYNMTKLKCNSRRLIDYNHQVFVPGRPEGWTTWREE
ncbi:hypothetical protein B0H10DRAFT_2040806 [Mycena sp. CBHHK59/15]|nr:hypothetical protein B0H10DRAFT_2040806 [Mycena sp. CBHHK59/15]